MSKEQKNQFLALLSALGSEKVRLLQDDKLEKIKPQLVLSSGNMAIDYASGIGGFPMDRILEIFGDESTGKSTIAGQYAARVNKKGLYVAYADFEHAVDVKYFRALGVRPDMFALCQPETGEEGLQFVLDAAATPECGLVVVDSVAAIVTNQELNGDLDDANVGATARLMGKMMRKIKTVCSVHNTTAIFINQNREKIGVMFGSPKTQPGGKALRFFASMRIELIRTGTNKDDGEAHSNKTKVIFRKNKLGPPYREAEFDLIFGKGADNERALLDFSVTEEIVVKKGRTYSYKGEILGIGEDNAVKFLVEDPETYQAIRKELLAKAQSTETKISVSPPKAKTVKISGDEGDNAKPVKMPGVLRDE